MNPEETGESEGSQALDQAKDNLFGFAETKRMYLPHKEAGEKILPKIQSFGEMIATGRADEIVKDLTKDDQEKAKALEKLAVNLDWGVKEAIQNNTRRPEQMVALMSESVTKSGRKLQPGHIENIGEVLLGYFTGSAANGEVRRPVTTLVELAKLHGQNPAEVGLDNAKALIAVRNNIRTDMGDTPEFMDKFVQENLGLSFSGETYTAPPSTLQ